MRRLWGLIMALPGYGLLIGKIIASRPKRRGTPHWLLMVHPATETSAVPRRCQSAGNREKRPTGRAAISDRRFRRPWSPGGSRQRAGKEISRPRIDAELHNWRPPIRYAAAGFRARRHDRSTASELHRIAGRVERFEKEFAKAVRAALRFRRGGGHVRHRLPDRCTRQGLRPDRLHRHREHSHESRRLKPRQRPAVQRRKLPRPRWRNYLFVRRRRQRVKFQSQTTSTDEKGNPTITKIKEIDETSDAVRRAIMPPFPRRAGRCPRGVATRKRAPSTRRGKSTVSPRGGISRRPGRSDKTVRHAEPKGYVFADFDPMTCPAQITMRTPTKPRL